MPTEQPDFGGMQVAAFESRHALAMARMIEQYGGVAHVSPSLREVPLEHNPQAIDFAHRLMTGQVDMVIFMTGVGTRHLIAQVERHVARDRFLGALADVTTVARGPKPVAALKEVGIVPTHVVPEPNTWREVLAALDATCYLVNTVVALQEYGQPNPSLMAGLEARGAQVIPLKVYDWELPEDTGPLEANVRAMADGRIDVVLFTSAHQVTNVVKTAEALDLGGALRRAMRRMVVASVGPATSEQLHAHEFPVDMEPDHPKMGHLVQTAAARARTLKQKKDQIAVKVLNVAPGPAAADQAPWHHSLFMKACRLEPCTPTPIWLMRQVGRYLPEYRKLREKVAFLELCKNAQLASELMVSAVERLAVDAAIIFSDLLPILEPMGMQLDFAQGEGPVIHNPLRESSDVNRLLELESVDALDFVMETARQTRADLPAAVPLIGFAGAPFTLASYSIEGGTSRSFVHTKTLMYRDPGAWHALMDRLVRAVTLYLNAQIASGVQAVQLFDTWVGCLGPDDYRCFVLPYVQRTIESLTPGVPVIHFATGNPALLPAMAEAGAAILGLDWRIRLDEAWKLVGYQRGVQGNLDPMALLAPIAEIRQRAGQILNQAAKRPGHIFNLGHGVLPQTPVAHARALVDAVHELSDG